MKIFPLSNDDKVHLYSHMWAVSKPTDEFVKWLMATMPKEWWIDHKHSVRRLLDQRQVKPKMIQICLNDDGLMLLKLKWASFT